MKSNLVKFGVEYLQNTPAIVGMVLAIAIASGQLFQKNTLLGMFVILSGAIASAVLIELTERYKADHSPSWEGFIKNAAIFSVGGVLFVGIIPWLTNTFPTMWSIYLALFAALIALVGGTLQGLGAPKPALAFIHGIALAIGIVLAFLPLKFVLDSQSIAIILAFTVMMNVLFSVPIYTIDYVLQGGN